MHPALPPSSVRAAAPRPLEGREWLAARAQLAARRTARFARRWSAALGVLVALALLLPVASSDPLAADRARFERLVADTLLTAQRVRRGEGAVIFAESLLATARREAAASPVRSVPLRAPVPTPRPTVGVRDPRAESLERAISEARRLRTVTAWLEVADEPTVSGGPRMRALADTLAVLATQREALPTGPGRDQQLAALTQRIGRLGYTILAIADYRLRELTAGPDAGDAAATPAESSDAPSSANESPARGTPLAARVDTAPALAALAAARDTLARARRAHDSLEAVVRAAESAFPDSGRSRLAAAGPALFVLAVLIVGLLLRFGAALRREMRAPTVAGAHEAERTSGWPVVAVVREALIDGPARYRPTGVDPFRMLYLGLTATGTRSRTAIITGADPVVIAAVGGRLAIAAAADHRTTLVVDLDPSQIALSRTFRERPEPGLTDAFAGAFKWREVARPVGSSDGLPITLIPAGTERDDLPQGEALLRAREEFTRFRSTYELTILVATPAHLERAIAMVEATPVVHCVETGASEVAQLTRESAALRAAGRRVHGVVLWEAVRPALPSRAELAALLSKRKGRTPGGSFEAVRKAVSTPPKQQ